MKKTILIIGAIVMMAGFSTRVMAQNPNPIVVGTSGTNTGLVVNDASAQLIIPMTLARSSAKGLNFGTINLGDGTGGSVTVSTLGVATVTSGNVKLSTFGNKQVASTTSYNVTGTYSSTYALSIDPQILLTNGTTVTGTSKNTMLVGNLRVSYTNKANVEENATGSWSTLDAEGKDSFTIGGTLTIEASQAGGLYAGTFMAAVDYN